MLITLLVFLLGVLVGGVVNQLGSDLPGRGTPTRPHCPYCARERPWWQWLGVVGYVLGRPECRSCGARIRLRRPMTEIGLGLTYGYLWIAFGPSTKSVFYGLYITILALVLITDFERRLILDVVTYPAMVLGLAGSFFVPGMSWRSAVLGGLVGFLFFFLVALIGHYAFGAGAMGGGDVKLAAFVGIITGFPLVIEAIVLTILIGAAVSLILVVMRIRGLRDHVPYGPFIVAGAILTLLRGYEIAQWFFR